MSMTAEQSAALAADEPSTEDTTTTEETPTSGEQPTTEQPAEGAPEGESEAGTEQPGGEQPEAEKKPEQPSGWKAVELAKKAQIKIAKDREALVRDKERVSTYEQRLTAHLATKEREFAARDARVKPLEEALERKDLAALSRLGFDFNTFAREALESSTPEGMARAAQKRIDDFEKKQREDAEQRQRQTAEQQRISADRTDAQTMVHLVEDSPDDCPELYAWAPERVADQTIRVRDAFRRQGHNPSYNDVLLELQKRARAEAGVAKARTSGLQQRRSPNPSDAGSAGKADPNRTSVGGNTPALTSRTANIRPPTPPREQTEEEIDEECKAMLRGIKR